MNTTKLIFPNIIGVCNLGRPAQRFWDKDRNMIEDGSSNGAVYVSKRYLHPTFQFITFDGDGDPVHCKTINGNMIEWIEDMRKEAAEWSALEEFEDD